MSESYTYRFTPGGTGVAIEPGTQPHNTHDRIEAAHRAYIDALQIQFKAEIKLCKAQAALARANRNAQAALADMRALGMEIASGEYDEPSTVTPDIGF